MKQIVAFGVLELAAFVVGVTSERCAKLADIPTNILWAVSVALLLAGLVMLWWNRKAEDRREKKARTALAEELKADAEARDFRVSALHKAFDNMPRHGIGKAGREVGFYVVPPPKTRLVRMTDGSFSLAVPVYIGATGEADAKGSTEISLQPATLRRRASKNRGGGGG